MAWLYVFSCVALTVMGQFVIKWRVNIAQAKSLVDDTPVLLRLIGDLWVWFAFAGAFLASLCWMLAMTKLPLSKAYPFTSLSFIIVMLISATALNEKILWNQWLGVTLVVLGLLLVVVRDTH